MKKIHMVIADNGQSYEDHDWWNVAAFTSEDAAQTYIKAFTAEIHAAQSRMEELGELMDVRELTEDEKRESEQVRQLDRTYWHFFDKGVFYITEIDLHE